MDKLIRFGNTFSNLTYLHNIKIISPHTYQMVSGVMGGKHTQTHYSVESSWADGYKILHREEFKTQDDASKWIEKTFK